MADLASAIDDLLAADPHALPGTALLIDSEAALIGISRLFSYVCGNLQAMHIAGVTVDVCGRTTKSWLVEEQLWAPGEAGMMLWVARRLVAYPRVKTAFDAGDITIKHAQLLLRCFGELPADWIDEARDELLAFAKEHDPGMLAELIRALRVMSGADESAEAAAQRRYASRHLTLHRTIDGMLSISGMVDPMSAAIIEAALAPLIAKKTMPAGLSSLAAMVASHDGDNPDLVDDRTHAQVTADALVGLAEAALAHDDLPEHGGQRAQVIVTIPYEELKNGLAARQVPIGTLGRYEVTPNTARMLACDADIIPAILGSRGEVLDLGRSTPTWSPAQRRARRIEDKQCVWPKCQVSLDRCQIHHFLHWTAHCGPTDLFNGGHLCPFHHWLVHHTPWTITRLADGTVTVWRTDRMDGNGAVADTTTYLGQRHVPPDPVHTT